MVAFVCVFFSGAGNAVRTFRFRGILFYLDYLLCTSVCTESGVVVLCARQSFRGGTEGSLDVVY